MKHKPKPELKPRNFYILHFNCDCAGYDLARVRRPTGFGPRCTLCNKKLGHMSFSVEGRVSAKTTYEAMQIWRKNWRTIQKEWKDKKNGTGDRGVC